METFFIFWIGSSIAVGIYAGNRGRNGIGWFLFGLCISSLLAFLLLLALPPRRDRLEEIVLMANAERLMSELPNDACSRELLAEYKAKAMERRGLHLLPPRSEGNGWAWLDNILWRSKQAIPRKL